MDNPHLLQLNLHTNPLLMDTHNYHQSTCKKYSFYHLFINYQRIKYTIHEQVESVRTYNLDSFNDNLQSLLMWPSGWLVTGLPSRQKPFILFIFFKKCKAGERIKEVYCKPKKFRVLLIFAISRSYKIREI